MRRKNLTMCNCMCDNKDFSFLFWKYLVFASYRQWCCQYILKQNSVTNNSYECGIISQTRHWEILLFIIADAPEITPDQFDWYFHQGRAIGFLVDLNTGSICNGKILLGSYMKKPLWVDHSATTVSTPLSISSSVTVLFYSSLPLCCLVHERFCLLLISFIKCVFFLKGF